MRRGSVVVAAALRAAACQGDGSDIGPRLDRLPDASCKVLVLDDAGAGVAGAVVAVAGASAVTGRSGRGDLLADPRGRRLVQVLAAAASATASDRLLSLSFAADLPGRELPFTVHLPDSAASATVTVPAGTMLPPTVLDDTAQSGARLELAAGTVVQAAPGAGSVTLRIGTLRPEHLPGALPPPPAGAWLAGRAFYVDPVVGFAPGATLEVPDDLALPGGATATLFWLDPSGEWTAVGGTATSSGGRLRLDGAVAGGGLYVYAAAVPATAAVRARVLDAKGHAVPGVLVRVDAQTRRGGDDGRFVCQGVPATLADGTPRAVQVELRAGGDWLPVGAAAATPALAAGTTTDLGDLTLDTLRAANVRVQMIERGHAELFRRLPLSSVDGLGAAVAFGDDRGQCVFDDVPFEYFGFLAGRPLDVSRLFVAEGLGFVPGGLRWFDVNAFFDDRFWEVGGRNCRATVLDSIGGGPVRDAVIVQGARPGQGFVGRTTQSGMVFADRNFDGRATAAVRTTLGGQTFISAFSIEQPRGERIELPVRRALRAPGGAFDRHGIASGAITGLDPLAEQRLRSTRLLELGEWFDAVALDVPLVGSVPVKVDPTLPFGSFRAGVAAPFGNLAAAEGTTSGGVFTLQKVGIAARLRLPEGAVTPLDVALLQAATVPFAAPQALADLDPAFTVADVAFDLALEQPDGLVVDVARAVGGNLVASGQDATLLLPPLQGPLQGCRWLAVLGAASAAGGSASAQRTLLRLDGSPPRAIPFTPLPVVTAPPNGAGVSATGFTVQFTLPPATDFATIELRSPASGGSDDLSWDVVLPPGRTEFAFVQLPAEAPMPLVAGRTYTLTLRAFRADDLVVGTLPNAYDKITSFWLSISAAERGVRAVSSQTITVTAN